MTPLERATDYEAQVRKAAAETLQGKNHGCLLFQLKRYQAKAESDSSISAKVMSC